MNTRLRFRSVVGWIACHWLLLLSVLPASAGIIAEDSFSYLSMGGGTLNGRNGGTGWAGAWMTNGSGNHAVSADATGAALQFTPAGGTTINGSAEAVDLTGTVNNPVVYRQLASAQNGTLYVAYLVRLVGGAWTDTDTFSLHLANNGANTTTLNLGLRGGSDFMVRNGTGAPLAGDAFGGSLAFNTTHYLVARLSKPGGSTTYDQIDMWLDPGMASSNAPNATLSLATGTGLAAVSHVFFRAAALEAGDTVRMDELKLGTSWLDVLKPAIVISNQPPSVTLTAPVNAATFTTPTNLLLQATAADADGTVTHVAFYEGNTKLGESRDAPYSFLWNNVAGGAYTLTARATDNEGAVTLSSPVAISVLGTNTSGIVSGELKKWHKVMITWTGPSTSETNANNPFRNYRLNVTFTHPASGKSYRVPGYFAADGDAANTSAQGGHQWRVNFAPDETGTWNYIASFRAGTDVALSASPTAGLPSDFDGAGGSFVIGPTDKTGRDHRGKGRLQYVGKHHLRFAETGEYFLKMGADSPENLLDYEDFDDQPNINSGNSVRKSWSPHAGDYSAAEASAYTWAGGKGAHLLGAIQYLSDKGMNAFSFVPFTLDADDRQVFPHRLVTTAAAYVSASHPRWDKNVVYHDRFDVSKMEQWERIFAYADQEGMYLHFKTQENENQLKMDGGNLGPERILYYRELIARYGHHLALNWNLGEEVNQASTAQKQAWSQYFYDQDPYHHHLVIHNMNDPHYDLLGNASHLTGFSLQKGPGNNAFSATLDYLTRSDAAGVPWVVAYDEQGSANDGIKPDANDPTHDSVRGGAIWAHVLAGGAGCEFYFGYAWAHSDLSCQDWRSRDTWWDQCRYALEFFKKNAIPFQNMTNRDSLLTGASGSHCFATNAQVYVGYLVTNATTSLNLAGVAGDFTVRWFNPFSGGGLQTGTAAQVTGGGTRSLGSPPANSTQDWVVLVKLVPPADTTPPSVSIIAPTNGAILPANLPVQVSATVTDNVAVAVVELHVDGAFMPPARTLVPFDFSVGGLTLGAHTLSVVAQDASTNRATNSVVVDLVAPAPPPLTWLPGDGGWRLVWTEPGFVLDHAFNVTGPWTNVVPPATSPYPLSSVSSREFFRLQWASP